MPKIQSLKDLQNIKTALSETNRLMMQPSGPESKVLIKVAMATCGIASGAKTILEYMHNELTKRNISAQLMPTGCMGYCYAEPTIEVTLPGSDAVVFGYVDEKKADEIIEKYIIDGELTSGIIPANYETIESFK